MRAQIRRWSRIALSALAIVYFILDAIFFRLSQAVFTAFARLGLFAWLSDLLRRLPPYAALAVFVVPLAVLEPAKPVGAWRIATGHPVQGIAIIVIAEIIKLVAVERMFHVNKDKLLTIPAFAWAYGWFLRWLDLINGLPGVAAAKRLWSDLRARAAALWRRWTRRRS